MLDTDIAWAVATRPATIALVALTLLLAWPLGRRRGRLGVLFVLTLGLVLAATATSRLFLPSPAAVGPYLAEFADPAYLVGGFAGSMEKLANIALFLPLGLLGTLLWRRPAAVLAGCVALTFSIEAWQSVVGRVGDAVDVVHNSVGALLGVVLARVWTYLASQDTV